MFHIILVVDMPHTLFEMIIAKILQNLQMVSRHQVALGLGVGVYSITCPSQRILTIQLIQIAPLMFLQSQVRPSGAGGGPKGSFFLAREASRLPTLFASKDSRFALLTESTHKTQKPCFVRNQWCWNHATRRRRCRLVGSSVFREVAVGEISRTLLRTSQPHGSLVQRSFLRVEYATRVEKNPFPSLKCHWWHAFTINYFFHGCPQRRCGSLIISSKWAEKRRRSSCPTRTWQESEQPKRPWSWRITKQVCGEAKPW